MKIAALIQAKGTSTRVHLKNRRVVAGKSLVEWAIDIGMQSKYIDEVFVSTECDIIQSMAAKAGAIPIDRPHQLILPKSGGGATQIHALKEMMQFDDYDYVVNLWCTSPLVQSWQVDDAIEKFTNQEYTKQLTAVTKVKSTELIHIQFVDIRSELLLSPFGAAGLPVHYLMMPTVRTNGAFGIYNPNVIDYSKLPDITEDMTFEYVDALYAGACEEFQKDINKTYGYEIDDISGWDIDTEDDILLAEYFLTLRKSNGGKDE